MKADTSRDSFQKTVRYAGVRQQQGRIQTDADWNEQIDIAAHGSVTANRDAFGETAAPRENPGFALRAATEPGSGASTLEIGAGRLYVNGRLCENFFDHLYTAQPDLPGAALPDLDGTYLAYLTVRSRIITAIENPGLREIALGGVDTTAREQTITQVQLLPIADAGSSSYTARSRPPEWQALLAITRGRLTARTVADGVPANPCDLTTRGGYTGTDNRLYRVEIHRGGSAGTATYKWSRNNATTCVEWLAQPDTNTLRIRGMAHDRDSAFAPGQWLEIDDEGLELEGRPGTLARIAQVDETNITIDPDSLIHFDPTITALNIADFQRGVRRVRRWDMIGAIGELSVPGGPVENWVELESGVEIRFDVDPARLYSTGDFWVIPARAISRNIEWPCDTAAGTPLAIASPAAPDYARLAIVQRDSAIWTVLADLRPIVPALSDANLTLTGGDGQALFPNARLAEALRVRLSNGGVPAPGVRVRFSVTGGAGTLEDTTDATNTGATVDAITDANGMCGVYWDTGADRDSQTASAVLIQDRPDAPDFNLPLETTRLYFRAHKTLATATEHSPTVMPDPSGADLMAGVSTVAQALDRLGETKVNRAGDVITGDLEILGNFTVRGDVIARDTDHMPGDVLLGDQDEDTITIHGTLVSEHSSDALVINDGVQINASNAGETPLAVNAVLQGFAGRLYRTAITIDNTANASALTNFQIALTIDTATLVAAGKLRADCGDLLFTNDDGQTTLAHWLESGANTATTHVWVRVPAIGGATTHTIFMYYGNPASAVFPTPESVFVRNVSGVLSAYNFDEGSGAVLNDLSGQGNAGVTVGGGVWNSGRFDGALNFNGSGQYVSLPAFAQPTSLNDFTVSVWAKFATGLPDGRYYLLDFREDGNPSPPEDSFAMIVDYVGGAAQIHHLLSYPGLPVFTEYQTPIANPAGVWTHFVLLRRGTNLEAYVNGNRIIDNFITGNPWVPPRTEAMSLANPKRIGSSHTSAFFHGDLDDVRLYNRALDVDEIGDLFAHRSYISAALPGAELVRRYAANDPTATAGSEEILSASEGSVLYIQNGSGNVGVGTDNPTEKLTVAGIIETTSGGIKFPDGTIQTTAGGGSSLISGGANLPMGTIIAWHRDLDGSIPALPDGWAECDGSTVDDPESPLFGKALPDLNGPRQSWNPKGSFLRGGATSGEFQNDQMQGHWHNHTGTVWTNNPSGWFSHTNGVVWLQENAFGIRGPSSDGTNGTPRTGTETRPVNMSVIWIIRIKDVGGEGGGFWSNATGGINFDEGNVGIDNNTPQAKLHVGGTPGVDGILFPDGTLQTTAGGGAHLPVGTIMAWHKSLTGTPALPDGWVECNGQTLNDPTSPYHGEIIPDLNHPQNAYNSKGSFLRGGNTSGDFEDDQMQGHSHSFTSALYGYQAIPGVDMPKVSGGSYTHPTINATTSDGTNGTPRTGTETRPVNMSVVWIMKIRDAAQINAGGYATLVDRKPPGVPGGQPTANAYNRRDLNQLETNIAGLTLANNQFTLPAGAYQILAMMPGHQIARNRAKLVNITDGVDTLYGISTNCNVAASATGFATIQGMFTILAPKTFEIQHYATATNSASNFGVESNTGEDEIYTQVSLLKLTAPGLPPRPQEIGFGARGYNHSSSGGQTVLAYSVIYTNAGNAFDGSKFTAPIAGLYAFSVSFMEILANSNVTVALRINGIRTEFVISGSDSAQRETASVSTVLNLAVGDVVDTTIETASGDARYIDPYSFSGHKI